MFEGNNTPVFVSTINWSKNMFDTVSLEKKKKKINVISSCHIKYICQLVTNKNFCNLCIIAPFQVHTVSLSIFVEFYLPKGFSNGSFQRCVM